MSALGTADRRATMRGVITRLGYSDELVKHDFPVWTGGLTVPVHLAGFGAAQPQDMTTATIVGHVVDDEASVRQTLALARALACPAALLAAPEDIQLWTVGSGETQTRLLGSSGYTEPDESIREYQRSLHPDLLLRAKHAHQQLTLFPIDVALLAHARSATASDLAARVTQAVASTVMTTAEGDVTTATFDQAAELVVAAITALVARDKFGQPNLIRPAAVLDAARLSFPGYFDWVSTLSPALHDALLDLIASLGIDINYAGLDPTVVSHVYEDALVSEASQKELGIYYTPPDLARSVARELPVEEIAPDERVVLDPACGSGSLLLAAYDRLREALPGRQDPITSHDYAKSHLLGYDADRFAVQIARLSLLLHAMPAGNHWQVERASIDDLHRALPVAPRIIFSNPPWRTLRWHGEGRHELADRFLLNMLKLVEPGGYLATILPASWLTSVSSSATREKVSKEAGVFEVWRLPRDTFGSSNLVPCVVFAQAKREAGSFVYRRVLARDDWKARFYRAGHADEDYLSTSDRPPDTWVRGPLDGARDRLRRLGSLAEVAHVQLGPPPRQPVRDRGGSGNDLWLRRARDLPAFGEAPLEKLVAVRYPEEFSKRTAERRLFDQHKLLVSSMSTGDASWRLKVGFDFRGIIPRQSLFMVVPRDGDDTTLFALASVLASSVASSWVGSLAPRLHIRSRFVASLPIPDLKAWAEPLAAIARTLKQQRDAGEIRLTTLQELEATVQDAYGLPTTTREALAKLFAGERAPDGLVRYEAPDLHREAQASSQASRHFGAVFDIDEDRVKLWIPGVTDPNGSWLTMPPGIPAWLCSPGRTFEALVDERGLSAARFRFQSRSYQELDDLRAAIRRA